MRVTLWRRALAVLAAALVWLGAAGLPAASASVPTGVGVLTCLHLDVSKPTALVVRCATADVAWSSVAWSSWGSSAATGKGRLVLNNCLPSCGKGHFHSFAATVVLSHVRQTGAYGELYSTARFSYVAKGKHVTKVVSLLDALSKPPGVVAPGSSYQGAFLSPLRDGLNCEIDLPGTGAFSVASVFCEIVAPAESVTMSASGSIKKCVAPKGTFGCIGDPGEGTPTLAYGKVMVAGPFRCLSSRSGVLCTTAKGSGFVISLSGITAVRGY